MEVTENNPSPVNTVGSWMITLIIASIPVVNLVMLFIWAFGNRGNPNKANWAKAMLLWLAAGLVITVLVLLAFGFTFMSMLESGPDFIENPGY